jgi:hypothetical protein
MARGGERGGWRRLAIFAVVALVSGLTLALGASPADAAGVNRYVGTPANGGSDTGNSCTDMAHPCATISHAVAVAADGDTIVVGPGTFTETVTVPASPSAAHTLTITGSAGGTTIQGIGGASVVSLQSGTTVTLSQLTITGGTENGGVANSGSATLIRDAVTGNGSGLNFGFGDGGGIANAAGATMQLSDSTVANNNAFGAFSMGGGISNHGTLVVTDSTIAGNGAGQVGGGGISNTGTATLSGTIISDNHAGTGDNCSGPVTDGGHNIDNGSTCGFGAGSQSNTDPQLGPLTNNGGPTATLAIGAGSPAVDAGRPGCAAVDQRGVPRPEPPGGACDVGAFEYSPGVVAGLSPTSGPAAGGTSVTVSGHGFTLATGVTFGGAQAPTFTVVNDTTITTVSPPGTGTVSVRVATPDGSGPDTAGSMFTYVSQHQTSLVANPLILRLHPLTVYLSMSARLLDVTTSTALTGQTIVFSTGGRVVCTAVTAANGTARCNSVAAFVGALTHGSYIAAFAGTPGLAPASSRAGLIA